MLHMQYLTLDPQWIDTCDLTKRIGAKIFTSKLEENYANQLIIHKNYYMFSYSTQIHRKTKLNLSNHIGKILTACANCTN